MKKITITSLIIFTWFLSFAQNEKLVIEGAIVIENNDDSNPVAGTIRWTGADFEGFDGTDWLSLTCCDPKPTTLTDQDGNDIPIVYIGSQCWMGENLRVTTYNDGTAIPFAPDGATWASNSAAAVQMPTYSWVLDTPSLASTLGGVYNWYAISSVFNGGKNICPVGWHLPTAADVTLLLQTLDINASQNSSLIAGGILKATGDTTAGTGPWKAPNTGATDDVGFTAIPSIKRNTGGSWFGGTPDSFLNLWTGYQSASGSGITIALRYDNSEFTTPAFSGGNGFACRCVKD